MNVASIVTQVPSGRLILLKLEPSVLSSHSSEQREGNGKQAEAGDNPHTAQEMNRNQSWGSYGGEEIQALSHLANVYLLFISETLHLVPITPTERNKGLKTIVKLQRLHLQTVLPSFACFHHFDINNNNKKKMERKRQLSVTVMITYPWLFIMY